MHGLQAPNGLISSAAARHPVLGASALAWAKGAEKLVFLVKIMRIALIVLLAYWLLIFVGTHLPAHTLPSIATSDKILHFAAFAGLAFLLAWAIPSGRWPLSRNLVIAAAIAFSYAVIDELTQQLVPGRTCDPLDIAADSVGILIGLATYLLARQFVIRIGWARRLLMRGV